MTNKKRIAKSVKHWKAMIKWVETQDKKKLVNTHTMQAEIHTNMGSRCCPLCEAFNTENDKCPDCPLTPKYGSCCSGFSDYTGKNAWQRVLDAETWAGWLQHGKRMLKQLESL